jgi:hypothetical protein
MTFNWRYSQQRTRRRKRRTLLLLVEGHNLQTLRGLEGGQESKGGSKTHIGTPTADSVDRAVSASGRKICKHVEKQQVLAKGSTESSSQEYPGVTGVELVVETHRRAWSRTVGVGLCGRRALGRGKCVRGTGGRGIATNLAEVNVSLDCVMVRVVD